MGEGPILGQQKRRCQDTAFFVCLVRGLRLIADSPGM